MWDLVVVGAGPAGAAAALSALQLRPDARVLLLDRAAFPRDKSCGDGIAPHAVDELRRLGVDDVLTDRVPVHRLRLRTSRGTEVSRPLRRPDHVVPREVFDARLVERAVARGAVLAQHTVRRLEVRHDAVVLDREVGGRVVVGADGANGVVRRLIGAPRQPAGATAVAVRGYADAPPGEPEQLILVDEEDWPSYAWSFPDGTGRANVGYGMLLPALRAKDAGGREVLHGRLAELLPDTAPERLVSHHLPLTTSRPRQPDGRVLLAGDAMSLINPLTGEGIYYALLSGRLAGAAALAGAGAGALHRADLRRALGTHLRHTSALARLTQHRGVVDAGVAAAARSRRAFDAFVELGLGRGLVTPALLGALAAELGRRALR
ncbi:MAG TPA: geranylgeranyl reductase family protein [Mycobacteriales bacterium]|nr:geranylgeranyl reductase family protein [Mycobacteriales bacterium]